MAISLKNSLSGIGIGGTPFGPLGGSLFKDGGKGKALKRLLQEMERKQNLGFARSQGYQLRGLDALVGGYDKALEGVKRTGSSAKLEARQTGAQSQAAVEQNYVNRGLSNTTVAAQVPAVSAGATQRTIAAIDASVSEAMANLEAMKGGAVNAAYGGLSALSQNYVQQQMMPIQMAFNQTAMQPTQFDQLMQLMGGVGGIAGMALGSGYGTPAGNHF